MRCVIVAQSLRLNNTAKRSSTVGEIVNLMSVDAQKLQEAAAYLHLLWYVRPRVDSVC